MRPGELLSEAECTKTSANNESNSHRARPERLRLGACQRRRHVEHLANYILDRLPLVLLVVSLNCRNGILRFASQFGRRVCGILGTHVHLELFLLLVAEGLQPTYS